VASARSVPRPHRVLLQAGSDEGAWPQLGLCHAHTESCFRLGVLSSSHNDVFEFIKVMYKIQCCLFSYLVLFFTSGAKCVS